MQRPLSPAFLSQLIGSIYDCALEPERWPETLTSIHTALDFANASLSLIELRPGNAPSNVLLNILVGPDSPWRENMLEYGEDMVEAWGGVTALLALPLDEPSVLSRIRGAQWHDNRAYREWAEPQGLTDLIALPLSLEGSAFGSIGMGRHGSKGEIGDLELDAARLLLPHVQRSVAISRLLDIKSVTASTFERVLDTFAVGVVLVDTNLGIVHANATATAMLSAGDAIRSERGVLFVWPPAVAAALGAAVRQADEEEAAIGRRGLGIPVRRADGAPCLLHVLPLRHGELRRGLASRAVAAVFVSPSGSPVPVPDDALAALFDLTRAEARIFEQVAAGRTSVETANALGIEITTVKTHLAHIFTKTGTRRQADLIKLAQSLAMPLRF
jgi:DNA-binding CsgD family transcriptional regulator